MSEYIKKTWKKGEEITSAALNNIETGITEAKRDASQVTATAQQAKNDAASALEAVKTVTPEGIGAADKDHTHTLESLGAAAENHTHSLADLGAAAQSRGETVTVAASAWTGDEAPFTATVASTLATAVNNLIVGSGGGMTAEQQEAISAANIICTGQALGSITLTAYGEKPTVDLPVNILLVG